jgi:hypothetical protein
MKIRIVNPDVNAIENTWGYEYDYSDTMEIDLEEWEEYLSVSFGNNERPSPQEVRDNLEEFMQQKVKEFFEHEN